MAYYETLKTSGMLGRRPEPGQPIANTWPAWEFTTPQYPAPSPYGLAREGYRKNEIVFACVQKRAGAVAEAPLRVWDDPDEKKRQEIADHDLRKLLRRPNPHMGEVEFWQASQIYLDIAGFCVWEGEFNRLGEPIALWPMRPDWCSFLRGPGNPLRAIRYQPPGLQYVDVDAHRCLVLMEFDPLYPMLKGLSRSAVALRVTSVDNAATDFLKLFFQNGAVVNGLLKTAQSLQESEAARIRKMWREQHGGVGNWVDPAVLGAGVEYQPMSMNFKDMDFGVIDGRDEVRICQIFETPPILVGAKAGLDRATYANYKEARAAFYEETVMPRWRWLESEIAQQLAPHFGEDAFEIVTEFDISRIRALQEDRDAKWTRANQGFTGGWATRDEARLEAGLEPIDGDVPVFAQQSTAVGQEVEQEKEEQQQREDDIRAEELAARQGAKDPEQMKVWRKQALERVGQGVGTPFDDELKACTSQRQTRAVFERHWPRAPEPTVAEIFAELVRAREAAERLGDGAD